MDDEKKLERAIEEAKDRLHGQFVPYRLAPRDPVADLASSLCLVAVCEGMPPEEIERTAAACRKAAEVCCGRYPHGSIDPAFNESFDAQVWAHAFVQIYRANPTIANDEGTMAGWFANALMRGFDEHARRGERGNLVDPSWDIEEELRKVARAQALNGGIDPNGEPSPVHDPNFARDWLEADARIQLPPDAVEGAQAVSPFEVIETATGPVLAVKPDLRRPGFRTELQAEQFMGAVPERSPSMASDGADPWSVAKPWPDPPTVADSEGGDQ